MNAQEKKPGTEPGKEKQIREELQKIHDLALQVAMIVYDEEKRAKLYEVSPPDFVRRLCDILFCKMFPTLNRLWAMLDTGNEEMNDAE